jgi:hypothetical protein
MDPSGFLVVPVTLQNLQYQNLEMQAEKREARRDLAQP